MNLIKWLYPGDALAMAAANVLVQTAGVVLVAALLSLLLRRRPAARHAVWLCALGYFLAAPAVVLIVERGGINLPFPGPFRMAQPPEQAIAVKIEGASAQQPGVSGEQPIMSTALAVGPAARPSEAMPAVATGREPRQRAWPAVDLLRAGVGIGIWVWAAGACILLARLVHGCRKVRSLAQELEPLDTRRWGGMLDALRQRLGDRSLPHIGISASVAGPLLLGLRRPTVVLPADLAPDAGSGQLLDVLVHECAHVGRRDQWVGLAQRLLSIVYWPHLLLHYANRQLDRAREEVCDNYVLAQADAPAYAETLLVFAQRYRPLRVPATSLAFIASRWRLDQRVAGLLDSHRDRAVRLPRLAVIAMAALFLAVGTLLAAAGLAEPNESTPAEAGDRPAETPNEATQRDQEPDSEQPADSKESRAWYILSQTDAHWLLHGMPQRLAAVATRSAPDSAAWQGIEGGGLIELDLEVEGEVEGEILVGFFTDARWWRSEPVQVRRFPKPGRYTVERLIPGRYHLGAAIGLPPDHRALGVHRTWPETVEIKAGQTVRAEVRVSPKFRDNDQLGRDAFAGDWSKIDFKRAVSVQILDSVGKPIPFSRLTVWERLKAQAARVDQFHELGTDEEGTAYFDTVNGPFSLSLAHYDTQPERMACLGEYRRFKDVYDSRGGLAVTLNWDPPTTGTGTVSGRVHDQHGKPLTEYYLTLTREVGKRQDEALDDYYAQWVCLPITDTQGRFEVGGLPAAEYTVMVRHFDIVTHAWTFDGPKFTIPGTPHARVSLNVEVEAKELLYGRAVYEDGEPIHAGRWSTWFKRDPTDAWGGESNGPIELDGSFRVHLSRAERAKLIANSAGQIKVSSYGEKGPSPDSRKRQTITIHIDQLSKDPSQPTVVKFKRPEPSQPDESGDVPE